MIKRYLQQTCCQMKAHLLLSTITVIGTALSIFLLMVAVMMQEVHTAPFSPESGRERMLHVQWMSLVDKETGESRSGIDQLSERVARACFQELETPEAVTVYSRVNGYSVSLPRESSEWVDVRGTDAEFWKVFDFTFIEGGPYDHAESEAGRLRLVITEDLARKLYGETKVSGREILLNGVPGTVCGVVKNVSTLASWSYAQVWVPYRALGLDRQTWADGMTGQLQVTILARTAEDFPKIREEAEQLRLKQSDALDSRELSYRSQPDVQEKAVIRSLTIDEPDTDSRHRRQWIVYAVLLIVPAINLISMTQGRFRRRMEEIGVRRAFGATRGNILWQVWMENFIITLFAGLLGLLLCIGFSAIAGDFLFSSSTLSAPLRQSVSVSWQLLFRPAIFGYAISFCLFFNVLSSGVPAWRASRSNVVNALGGH